MKFLILLMSVVSLFSCTNKIDSATYIEKQKMGNAIASQAQTTLLKNVGEAIQKGGSEYAVEFCNLEASRIIDGLNEEFNCTIKRVSEKNRNPNAFLSSKEEKEIWALFQKGMIKDTILQEDENLIFYQPIRIGMPACLKCHGETESDINAATHKKLQVLYPNDLATGYALKELRGLWKIEFARD